MAQTTTNTVKTADVIPNAFVPESVMTTTDAPQPENKKKEQTKLIVWAVLILAAGFLAAKYIPFGK